MKNSSGNSSSRSIRHFIFAAVLLLALAVSSTVIPRGAAAAGTPTIMSYQGRLTDASGNLLGSASGTNYYFKFSIWDVASGGTAGANRLWPATDPQSVTLSVRSGVFNANIGDTAGGYPDVLDYDFNVSSNIFLEVEVSSDNVTFQALTPRQRIASAPFARISGAVSGTSTSSFGTTSPIANSVVTVEATTTTATALTLRGILNQVANLFQIQSSTGSNLFSINSLGGIFASSTMLIGPSSGNTAFAVNGSGNVGVGTVAPSRRFNVLDVDSEPQIRVGPTATEYGEIYVDSAGDVQMSATGGNVRQNDENVWVCSGGGCGAAAPASRGNLILENSLIFNNNFKFQQTDASTTIMYDTLNTSILEFDEGE